MTGWDELADYLEETPDTSDIYVRSPEQFDELILANAEIQDQYRDFMLKHLLLIGFQNIRTGQNILLPLNSIRENFSCSGYWSYLRSPGERERFTAEYLSKGIVPPKKGGQSIGEKLEWFTI